MDEERSLLKVRPSCKVAGSKLSSRHLEAAQFVTHVNFLTRKVGYDGIAYEHPLFVGHDSIGCTHGKIDPRGLVILEAARGGKEVGGADSASEDKWRTGLPP